MGLAIPLSVLVLSNFIRDVPKERAGHLARLPAAADPDPEPREAAAPSGAVELPGAVLINIPAVLASVMLTTLPILLLYVIGRRQLLSGLTAGFSK